LTLPALATPDKFVKDHSRYCVPSGSGWMVQGYAPLVDTRKGTVVVQAIYSGSVLTHVLVKNYNERYELMYDYRVGEDGRLVALRGYLERWGQWLAEADLYPDADGLVPRPDVNYRQRSGGSVIVEPDDGPNYVGVFQSVPVYRTAAEMPCAVLFQEAEKMNATQK
jgi:hypothetical protein